MEEEKSKEIVFSEEETAQIFSELNHEDRGENELPVKCDIVPSEPDCNRDSSPSGANDSRITDDHETKVENCQSFSIDRSALDVLENADAGNQIDPHVMKLVSDNAIEAPKAVDSPSDNVYEESATDAGRDDEKNVLRCLSDAADRLYSSPTNQITCSSYKIDTFIVDEIDASASQAICDTYSNDLPEDSDQTVLSTIVHPAAGDVRPEGDMPVTEYDIGSNDREESFLVTELMSNETISDLFDKVYDRSCNADSSKELPERLEMDEFDNRVVSADFRNEESILYNLDLRQKSDLLNAATKSSLKRPSDRDESGGSSPCKKSKKGITFNSVSVYYFPRTQGFTCIPSQGGSTLGMSWNHSHIRTFSLGEHAAEQRRAHRQYCSQQFSSPRNWNDVSTMSSDDSDSDEIISDSEMDFENYNFLQPIPTRERRAMLRAAGIHKIDSEEKDECRSIRLSREFCGCTCQIYCDPERCVCAQAGIKCQVDRMNFPCSCTRDGCANEHGRIEFNPVRVRTHYIHTLMRLEMDKKKEEEEQRNRLILNNLESSSQLSYSSSSSSSSSVVSGGASLMNFSYHNDLQSYYQPATAAGYGMSTSAAVATAGSCFNFAYAPNEQFVLPAADTGYQTSADVRLAGVGGEAMQYCAELSSCQEERLSEYVDDPVKRRDDENFIIRDLTNGSKSSDSNEEPYGSESFIQLGSDNFERRLDDAGQSGALDTSAEVSEETEKEESDTENFGDIIKKTMVESVIA